MKEYKFTIQYDGGTHKLTTRATNIEQALKAVMNAEKCPEGAILNIKIKRLNDVKSKI